MTGMEVLVAAVIFWLATTLFWLLTTGAAVVFLYRMFGGVGREIRYWARRSHGAPV